MSQLLVKQVPFNMTVYLPKVFCCRILQLVYCSIVSLVYLLTVQEYYPHLCATNRFCFHEHRIIAKSFWFVACENLVFVSAMCFNAINTIYESVKEFISYDNLIWKNPQNRRQKTLIGSKFETNIRVTSLVIVLLSKTLLISKNLDENWWPVFFQAKQIWHWKAKMGSKILKFGTLPAFSYISVNLFFIQRIHFCVVGVWGVYQI